jgi:integrase
MADNITKLANGRFLVRLRFEGERQIRERFDTLEHAVYFRDQIKLDRTLRRHGLPGVRAARPQLRLLIDTFLADAQARVSTATLMAYQRNLRPVLVYLDAHHPRSLCADEVDNRWVSLYVTWRISFRLSRLARRQATQVMARKDLEKLAAVYAYAGVSRSWSIPKRMPRQHGKRVLDPVQMFAFLDAMKVGSLERTVAETAIATGLRPSDLWSLRRDQVSLPDGLIRTKTAKTGAVVVVPLTDDLVEHIRAWLSNPERVEGIHGLLFTLQGRKVNNFTLRRRFAAASRVAGITPIVEFIGSARNYFIAALLSANVNPYAAARLVGHKDLTLLMRYAQRYIPLGELRNAVEALQEHRESWKSGTTTA